MKTTFQKTLFLFAVLWLSLLSVSQISAQAITVKFTYIKGDFKLSAKDQAAGIYYSPDDFKVVRIAAQDLVADVERVSGKKPVVHNDLKNISGEAVFIGTLGKNALIDKLVKEGKLKAGVIRGKWESYIIATVKNPLPNVPLGLFIVGSDRRGTAYGVYELSQMIGVSPWYWWADVTPEHRDSLVISPGMIRGGEPSVKYRGIFLNDEDWGLQPWAAKTFEPKVGDIGPKTYAKIFELLLRLKANTVWPAMHEVTKPFNSIPGNAQMADDYGIVMGSSHAEPMLRNNVGEWKDEKDRYDFKANPDGVKKYWEDRVAANGKFENIYTLGMRGIHDSPIQGVKNQPERIALLEQIFDFQRSLLEKYVNPAAEKVPQIFCPYKEVLADYRAGLKVPADATIVFPDDNFGYIRQFPSVAEQKHPGGFGVYYHISYLGRPLSYLWLETTPPALIWEEMSKAYDHNMRKFWIVNVGDIKPGEIGTEFFLQMAWDMKRWRRENLPEFLKTWAAREFGETHSTQIAGVMKKYYDLNFQRKPEHLQWHLPNEKAVSSDLTAAEIEDRLDSFDRTEKAASNLYSSLPTNKKEAFYELVLYPVRMSRAANYRVLAVQMAVNYSAAGSFEYDKWILLAREAEKQISNETVFFNDKLASGKWRGIMSPEMGKDQWPSMRSTPPQIPEQTFTLVAKDTADTPAPAKTSPSGKFVESNGVISIEAEHFTNKLDRGFNQGNAGWEIIPGLGRRGDSVAIFPTTARSIEQNIRQNSPVLEYDFYSFSAGEFDLSCYLIPTQPLQPGKGLRYAVGVDNELPQIVAVDAGVEVSSRKWAQNVLDASTVGTSKIRLTKGSHVLKIYMVDAGVVLDNIVINTGGLPKSYLGPPETMIKKVLPL